MSRSTALGLRKSALVLATLSASERRRLLGALPAATAEELSAHLRELGRRGLMHRAAIERVLAEDLRGLTEDTTLRIEQLMAMAGRLPAPWFARVLEAAGPIDREFLLALLDEPYARDVRAELGTGPALAPAAAKAILEWAMSPGGNH